MSETDTKMKNIGGWPYIQQTQAEISKQTIRRANILFNTTLYYVVL